MLKNLKNQWLAFISYLSQRPVPQKLVAISCGLVAFLYPGQNYLQTLIIQPGEVRTYTFPTLAPFTYPVSDGTNAPALTAQSVVIQDADSKVMLYQKNPDRELLPASTTKVMTALVALEYYDLSKEITVQNEDRAVGSSMELVKGETMTVENLLFGLLVDSANDAALTLAENYPGGYDAFVIAMNEKAKELHLDATTYRNVSGVESYGHMTTARDLAVLASEAVKNPVVNRIMQTKNIVVTDTTGNKVHELVSTNELLGNVPGLLGLKTGWTQRAGECLVSYIERDGRRVIIVVLNSADRFGETKLLVDWVYSHHTWQLIDTP